MTSTKPNKRIVISSAGHFNPPHQVANNFFDQLDIGSEAGWIADRTGIVMRRSVLPPEVMLRLCRGEVTLADLRERNEVMSIATLCEPVWDLMNERATIDKSRITAVACGTSIPDYDVPANAASIAGRLGIDALAYDANSACSSFIVNLHLARGLIASGLAREAAIFIPERYTLRIDYRDRASCVLFGDGAAGAVVSGEATSGLEVIDTIVTSDPSKFDLITIPDNGTFRQSGSAVQKFAILRTIEVTQDILRRNNVTLDDVHYVIGHQANLRMLMSVMQKLDVPSEKHLFNVDQFGNQGGAGAPSVLSMNWDKFRSGDLIVMALVGSGLTWASALFRKI